MKIICINTLYAQTISCTRNMYLFVWHAKSIDKNKALNQINCLNLRKLMPNIGKMLWNAETWKKTSRVST